MNSIQKMFIEIATMPFMFLFALMFAWIPMLGWNWGIQEIFPSLPEITYLQAFWGAIGLNYLKLTIVTVGNFYDQYDQKYKKK